MKRILTAVAAVMLLAGQADAQNRFPVCETQQALEQLLQSKGQIMPDGCRTVSVATVETGVGRLCAIDLSRDEPGIVGALREAAANTRWWTACENLTRR